MSKVIDLTGKRFGRLTVIERDYETQKKKHSKNAYWRCQCKCGNKKSVDSHDLKRGNIQSCGCLTHVKMYQRQRNLIGKRFGRLTVQAPVKSKKGSPCSLECRCECGNKIIVETWKLKSGNVKSCGCLRNENSHNMGNKNIVKTLIKRKKAQVEGTDLIIINTNHPLSNSKSGVRGVYWVERHQSWSAELVFKGKKVLHKEFKNKQDAINARKEAEEKYFKPILKKYGKL